jgi:hypothetical protein
VLLRDLGVVHSRENVRLVHQQTSRNAEAFPAAPSERTLTKSLLGIAKTARVDEDKPA